MRVFHRQAGREIKQKNKELLKDEADFVIREHYRAPVMFLKYSVAYSLPSRLVSLEDSINSPLAGAAVGQGLSQMTEKKEYRMKK